MLSILLVSGCIFKDDGPEVVYYFINESDHEITLQPTGEDGLIYANLTIGIGEYMTFEVRNGASDTSPQAALRTDLMYLTFGSSRLIRYSIDDPDDGENVFYRSAYQKEGKDYRFTITNDHYDKGSQRGGG